MAIEERKKSDGTWSYRARVKDAEGAWFPSAWYPDRDVAVGEEAKLLGRKRLGGRGTSRDARIYTFRQYWEVWSIDARTDVSEGWRKSQDQMYRDYLESEIGDLKLAEVDALCIKRLLNRARSGMPDGKPRAPATVGQVYALIHSMLESAVRLYRMLDRNPADVEGLKPVVPKQAVSYLEPGATWSLLEAARGTFIGPAVWLQGLAGMRTEAVVVLTWEDISWDKRQAVIRRAYKRKIRKIEEYPKGKKADYVPLCEPLVAYLREIWMASSQDPKAFVCQGPQGGMLANETYSPNLKRLCRKTGVREISPHGLRHSHTELLVNAGGNQTDIQRMLNHASVSTSARYMHRSDERLNAVVGKIQRPELRLVTQDEVPTELPTVGNFDRIRDVGSVAQAVQT
jgi:integrase